MDKPEGLVPCNEFTPSQNPYQQCHTHLVKEYYNSFLISNYLHKKKEETYETCNTIFVLYLCDVCVCG